VVHRPLSIVAETADLDGRWTMDIPKETYICCMNIRELYNIYKKYPSIETDTRKLKKGDIFFALKGPHFNGNSFAEKAIDAGAAYAVSN
jgi:UDP-N-acetylmuramyl pentapeptide synthase